MEYIGYILLGLVVVIALYAVGGYNSLVSLRNQVEEAFSTMDVYLTKRYDLIPNLVETVNNEEIYYSFLLGGNERRISFCSRLCFKSMGVRPR